MIKRLLYKYLLQFIPDILWIKVRFRVKLGYWPNLKNPRTCNEKLQWLKLHNRNPLYTQLVDKYEVRNYIKDKIGSDYLVPLLGKWDKFDDIDFDKLPNQFVLKCNHDSGGLIICKDKSSLNYKEAKKKLSRSLKFNYYWALREWPYKNVKPCIIAEKYLEDTELKELKDYKFYCFNGTVKIFFIASGRQKGDNSKRIDYFNMNREHLPMTWGCPRSSNPPQMPQSLNKMIQLAEVLSKGIPHIRVDFYEVDGKIYFGEMTFFDGSGMEEIKPHDWDLKLGSWISLNV